MFKRTANPKRAAVPIQNQFLSGKTWKFFNTATPNGVTLSEAYIKKTEFKNLRNLFFRIKKILSPVFAIYRCAFACVSTNRKQVNSVLRTQYKTLASLDQYLSFGFVYNLQFRFQFLVSSLQFSKYGFDSRNVMKHRYYCLTIT